MSWNFYRRLTVVLLSLAAILSLVLFMAAAFLYGGRFTIFSALLLLLILSTIFVVVMGIRTSNQFNREVTDAIGKIASGQLGAPPSCQSNGRAG